MEALQNINLLETFISDQEWDQLAASIKRQLIPLLLVKNTYSEEYVSSADILKLFNLVVSHVKFPNEKTRDDLNNLLLTLRYKVFPEIESSVINNYNREQFEALGRFKRIQGNNLALIFDGSEPSENLNRHWSRGPFVPNKVFEKHVRDLPNKRGSFFQGPLYFTTNVVAQDHQENREFKYIPSPSPVEDDAPALYPLPLHLGRYQKISELDQYDASTYKHFSSLCFETESQVLDGDFSRVFFFLIQAYSIVQSNASLSYQLHMLYWSILEEASLQEMDSLHRRLANWLYVVSSIIPTHIYTLKRTLEPVLKRNVVDEHSLFASSSSSISSVVDVPLRYSDMYMSLLTFQFEQTSSDHETNHRSAPLHDLYLHFYAHYLWLMRHDRKADDLISQVSYQILTHQRKVYYGEFWDSIQTVNGQSIYSFNYARGIDSTEHHRIQWRALGYGIIELELTKRRFIRSPSQVTITHLRALLERLVLTLAKLLRPYKSDEERRRRKNNKALVVPFSQPYQSPEGRDASLDTFLTLEEEEYFRKKVLASSSPSSSSSVEVEDDDDSELLPNVIDQEVYPQYLAAERDKRLRRRKQEDAERRKELFEEEQLEVQPQPQNDSQISYYYPVMVPRYWHYSYNTFLTQTTVDYKKFPVKAQVVFHPKIMMMHFDQMKRFFTDENYRTKRADELPASIQRNLASLLFFHDEEQVFLAFLDELSAPPLTSEQLVFKDNVVNNNITKLLSVERVPIRKPNSDLAPLEVAIDREDMSPIYRGFSNPAFLRQIYRLSHLRRFPERYTFPVNLLQQGGLNEIPANKSVFLYARTIQSLPADVADEEGKHDIPWLETYIRPFLLFERGRTQFPKIMTNCACLPVKIDPTPESMHTELCTVSVPWTEIGQDHLLAPDIRVDNTHIKSGMQIQFCVQLILGKNCFIHASEQARMFHLMDSAVLQFVNVVQLTYDPDVLRFMLVFKVSPDLRSFKQFVPHFDYDHSMVNPDDRNMLMHMMRLKANSTFEIPLRYHPHLECWVFSDPRSVLKRRLFPINLPNLFVNFPLQRYETVWENTKYTPLNVFLLRSQMKACIFLITEQVLGWPAPLIKADFYKFVPASHYRSDSLSIEKFLTEKKKQRQVPFIDREENAAQRSTWLENLFWPAQSVNDDVNETQLRNIILQHNLTEQKEAITSEALRPFKSIHDPNYSPSFTMKVFKVLQAAATSSPTFRRTVFPTRVISSFSFSPAYRAYGNEYNVPRIRYYTYVEMFKASSIEEADFSLFIFDSNDEIVLDEDRMYFYNALYLYITDSSPKVYNGYFREQPTKSDNQKGLTEKEKAEKERNRVKLTEAEWDPISQRRAWRNLSKEFLKHNLLAYDPLVILDQLIAQGKIGIDPEMEKDFNDRLKAMSRVPPELQIDLFIEEAADVTFLDDRPEAGFEPQSWFTPHLPGFQLFSKSTPSIQESEAAIKIGGDLEDDSEEASEAESEEVEEERDPSNIEDLNDDYDLKLVKLGNNKIVFAENVSDDEEEALADLASGEKDEEVILNSTGGPTPFQRFDTDVHTMLLERYDYISGHTAYKPVQKRTPFFNGIRFSEKHRSDLLRAVVGRYLIDYSQSYPQLKLTVVMMNPFFHMLITRILPTYGKIDLNFALHREIWYSILKQNYSLVFIPTFLVDEEDDDPQADISSGLAQFSKADTDISYLEKYIHQYLGSILNLAWRSTMQQPKGTFSRLTLGNKPVLDSFDWITPKIYMPTFHVLTGGAAFKRRLHKANIFPTHYIPRIPFVPETMLTGRDEMQVAIIGYFIDTVAKERMKQLGQFRPLKASSPSPSSSSSSSSGLNPTEFTIQIMTFYSLKEADFKADDEMTNA